MEVAAASGHLSAQRGRMNIIAGNLAKRAHDARRRTVDAVQAD